MTTSCCTRRMQILRPLLFTTLWLGSSGLALPDLLAVTDAMNFSSLPDVMTFVQTANASHIEWTVAQPKLLPTVTELRKMPISEAQHRKRFWLSAFVLTFALVVMTGTGITAFANFCKSHGSYRLAESNTDSAAASMRQQAYPFRPLVFAWFVVCFVATFLVVLVSFEHDRLSKSYGLDWEAYFGLFLLNCTSMLLQAVLAGRQLPPGKTLALTSFGEACLAGLMPVLSDQYDTLKDLMFSFLCFQSKRFWSRCLGVASMFWLVLIHILFFMNDNWLLHLAESHIAMLMMPTEKPAGASSKEKRNKFLAFLYKQVTPTKQKLLIIENVPQAILALAFVLFEGQSFIVTFLNLVVPASQIVLAHFLWRPLHLRVAPHFGKKLRDAVLDRNWLRAQCIWQEADFEKDLKLFRRAVLELHPDNSGMKQMKQVNVPEQYAIAGLENRMRLVEEQLIEVPQAAMSDDQLQHFLCLWKFLSLQVVDEDLVLADLTLNLDLLQLLAEALQRQSSIRMLDLSHNPIPPEGAKALENALQQTNLQRLYARRCQLGSGLQTASCQEIYLDGNGLSNEGVVALAKLHIKSNIQVLDLSHNAIHANGAKALAEMMSKNERLKKAIFRGCQLEDSGALEIAVGLENTACQEIDLDGNAITDEGAKAVASGLKMNTGLLKLILDWNKIADGGAKALAAARVNKTLEELLQSNSIGPEGQEALAQSSVKLDLHGNYQSLPGDTPTFEPPQSFSLNSDDTLVRIVATNGRPKKWLDRLAPRQTPGTHDHHEPAKMKVCMVDSTTIAAATNGLRKLWDTPTAACTATVQGHKGVVCYMCSAGSTIACCFHDGSLELWDVHTGECNVIREGTHRMICGMDSTSIASVTTDHCLKVWDVSTAQCKLTTSNIKNVCSPICRVDSATIATGAEMALQLWDIHTGKCKLYLDKCGNTASICRVDAATIAAIQGESLQLWDIHAGRLRHTLSEHTSEICCVCRVDPSTIATASKDHFLKLWQIGSGTCECKVTLRDTEHTSSVLYVCRMDATTIASTSEDNRVKIWTCKDGKQQELILEPSDTKKAKPAWKLFG